MKTERLLVTGHVQGVGFRYTTMMLAQNMEVTGTVTNLPDGSVEIILQTTPKTRDNFIQALYNKKINPVAKIDAIAIDEITTEKNFSDFKVKY